MAQLLLDEYLLLYAPPPQGKAKTTDPAGKEEGGELFQLPDVISEGERNNTLFSYGCQLRATGRNREEITVLLNYQNENRCELPLDQAELDATINQVCKYEIGRTANHDLIEAAAGFKTLAEAIATQAEGTDDPADDTEVTCLDDVEECDPEWLIDGYLPKHEITVLAGDGGVGKTFVWCAIAAAISSGNKPFLLNNTFQNGEKTPEKVMYFSSEDSNEAVLRPRLRENGANLKNIITIDVADERFQKIQLNSSFLEKLLEKYRPVLCIFDPLQSFLPRGVNMISRNDMRNAMAKLHIFGERYGTTFLIVMHTNKKADVSGRNRLADSADIWDISRSVLIAGKADVKGATRYVSHEKSSYGKESETVLFRIAGKNTVEFASYTDKRDRDFVQALSKETRSAPAREAAEQFIIDYLTEHGESTIKELNEAAKGDLLAMHTVRDAKESLKAHGNITIRPAGKGQSKGTEWLISLRESGKNGKM